MRVYLLYLTITAVLFGFQLGASFAQVSYSPSTLVLTGGILLTFYLLAPVKK